MTDYLQQKSHMMMIKTVNWRSFCHVQMLQYSARFMRADRGAVFGDDAREMRGGIYKRTLSCKPDQPSMQSRMAGHIAKWYFVSPSVHWKTTWSPENFFPVI